MASSPVDHVLSLVSPDAEAPSHRRDTTVLRFNDIIAPKPGLVAPDRTMVQTILDLGRALAADSTLLIHCFAGVSRSPAAAYVLACAAARAGDEDELARRLRAASPRATPNALMIALADQALCRGGAMTAAIAAIGRGEDAFEGDVIDWTI